MDDKSYGIGPSLSKALRAGVLELSKKVDDLFAKIEMHITDYSRTRVQLADLVRRVDLLEEHFPTSEQRAKEE